MENKEEYVWWAEDHEFFSEQIFSSLDEAMKSATIEYQKAEPVMDTEYFSYNYDKETDTEELSPYVLLGRVERLDVDDLINHIFKHIVDTTIEYHNDFSFHCDGDPEFDTTQDADNKLKDAIRKWLESAYVSPSMVAAPMYEFNSRTGERIQLYDGQ